MCNVEEGGLIEIFFLFF